MIPSSLGERIAAAEAGDGSYEGSRKLYLQRSLKMTPLERLQAVEEMGETATFIQRAAGTYGTAKRLRNTD
jgi:hypothetical protein